MVVMHMHVKGQTQRGSRQTAARRLSGHLHYLEGGALSAGYGLFSASADSVTRRAALDDLLARASNRVQYHRLVLAPDPEAGVPDLRAWTRAVLGDLADAHGQRLHWYAVAHTQAGQPHVHVVLAGTGECYATGRREPVRLGTAAYTLLAASGQVHTDEDVSSVHSRRESEASL
jgi:hypothetical protein